MATNDIITASDINLVIQIKLASIDDSFRDFQTFINQEIQEIQGLLNKPTNEKIKSKLNKINSILHCVTELELALQSYAKNCDQPTKNKIDAVVNSLIDLEPLLAETELNLISLERLNN